MSFLLDYLAAYFSGYSYLGFFLILAIGGLGLPIPEEITLVAAGLFVAWGKMELGAALAVCAVGMLVGDLVFFAIGHVFGQRPLQSVLTRFAPADRIERTTLRVRKYGLLTVFFGRYLTGIRPAVFLAAGAMRIPVAQFLLFDGLSAVTSLALWVFIGIRYSTSIELILHRIGQLEESILAVVAAIVVVIAIEKLLIYIHRLEADSRPVRLIQAARVPIIVLTAFFAVLLARQHDLSKRARLTENVIAGIPGDVQNPGLLLDLLPKVVSPDEPVDFVLVASQQLLITAMIEAGYQVVRPSSVVLMGRPATLIIDDVQHDGARIALWRSTLLHRKKPVWLGRILDGVPAEQSGRMVHRLLAAQYAQRISVGPPARPPARERIQFAVLRPPRPPDSPAMPVSAYNPEE